MPLPLARYPPAAPLKGRVPDLVRRRALEAVVRKAGLLPGDAVLEVGCGTGLLSVIFAKQWTRCRLLAVDDDVEALARARANAKAEGVSARVDFLRADPRALPFKTERFPLVISAFHLSTLRGPGPTLAEMFRCVFFYGKALILDLDLSRGASLDAPKVKGVAKDVFRSQTLDAMRDMGFGKVKVQRLEVLPGGASLALLSAKRFEGDEEPAGDESEA